MNPLIKLKKCQDYAKTKNGICLEAQYVNSHTKMLWQCSCENQWLACWSSIYNAASWCPKCNHKSPHICQLKEYAINKKGILLSSTYITNTSKLEWQCENGHQWWATWNSINHGCWCPICVKDSRKTDIKELQQYAINKKGLLLSNKYINCMTKYIWKCEYGHIWTTKWNSIKTMNSWCPECSSFKTERLCKKLLEQKLKIIFTKTTFFIATKRYQWDGYNEEYKIAFEYHGYQHYTFPNMFHKTKQDFIAQQNRDKEKEQYCIDNNINLIVIPHTAARKLETYITNLGIILP